MAWRLFWGGGKYPPPTFLLKCDMSLKKLLEMQHLAFGFHFWKIFSQGHAPRARPPNLALTPLFKMKLTRPLTRQHKNCFKYFNFFHTLVIEIFRSRGVEFSAINFINAHFNHPQYVTIIRYSIKYTFRHRYYLHIISKLNCIIVYVFTIGMDGFPWY